MRKKIYRLYIMSLDRENFSIALDERFSRITPLYILLYTDKKMRGLSEIKNEEAWAELSKADMEWLKGCNLCIIHETLQRYPNMLKEAQMKFYADLEKQLELVIDEEFSDGRKESSAE